MGQTSPLAWLGRPGRRLIFVAIGAASVAGRDARAAAPELADDGSSLWDDQVPGAPFELEPQPDPEPPSEASAGAPRVFYLWYADGSAAPARDSTATCGTATIKPPAFNCPWGKSNDDCKRQVQALLDSWYQDFNIIFVHQKPNAGRYYTALIAENCVQWCPIGCPGGAGAGWAPYTCTDLNGDTAMALQCEKGAIVCAQTIAQEQAHLVGLQHTSSTTDLLYPQTCPTCTRSFEDKQTAIYGDMSCRSTQNSHKMMLDALGAWPMGMSKPAPLPDGAGGAGGGGQAGMGGGSGAGGAGNAGAAGGNSGGGGGTGGAANGGGAGGASGSGGRGGSGAAGGAGAASGGAGGTGGQTGSEGGGGRSGSTGGGTARPGARVAGGCSLMRPLVADAYPDREAWARTIAMLLATAAARRRGKSRALPIFLPIRWTK